MQPDNPLFTIVIATFDRGPLIAATLESVAAQSLPDYEVLVVSDGPEADGLAETVARFGDRFELHQLETRTRSQSAPNNHGWAAARGRYVAYLGHDDIWNSQHLERLAEAFATGPTVSFAVSGCVYFGPEGVADNFTWVTGLFDSSNADIPRDHFFPPSSFAHRRDLPVEIPPWPDPTRSRDPVDAAFLKGAASADLRFVSTGVITVYKFASAVRYLSYLYPDDSEQRRMLERLQNPEIVRRFVDSTVEQARRAGRFMHLRYSTAEVLEPGGAMRRNEVTRGIAELPLVPLGERAWMAPGQDSRGLDWLPAESYGANQNHWRWSGPSASPRLRIPVTAAVDARFVVHIGDFASDTIRDSLSVQVDRSPAESTLTWWPESASFRLTFVAPLHENRETVLEFRHPPEGGRGFCLLGIGLEPESVDPAHEWPEADRSVRDRALAQRDEAIADLALVVESRTWRLSERLRSLRRRQRRNRKE